MITGSDVILGEFRVLRKRLWKKAQKRDAAQQARLGRLARLKYGELKAVK